MRADDADSSPPIHQKNIHELITSSLDNCYKTSHYHHSFEGISLPWLPFPDKAIKLSSFTSPESLSPRSDSVLVYREAE